MNVFIQLGSKAEARTLGLGLVHDVFPAMNQDRACEIVSNLKAMLES